MTQAFNLSQLANKVNTSGQLDASTGLVNITPVANGGTGRSSVTAGNLLLGAGTSAMTLLAGTAAGQGVLWNGTTWTAGVLVGSAPQVNTYIAPGTWTKPGTLVGIKVTVIGGGGTGGTGTYGGLPAVSSTGSGGGGGGAAIRWLSAPAIPGPIAVTAGSGTNSFGALASATGGSNGTSSSTGAVGGTGGLGSSGNINLRGQPGGISKGGTVIGNGGSTILGSGAGAIVNAGVGNAGNDYGGGGGGGYSTTSPVTNPGGAGASGIVIVEEFY